MLKEYSRQLDADAARHLLRRTCFGPTPERMAEIEGKSALQAASLLIGEANTLPLPSFGPADDDIFPAYIWTVERMLLDGFREKMTLFWHDHFVISLAEVQDVNLFYRYWTRLRSNAFGNFRTFTSEIARDPAMLVYLNGDKNTKATPNENFGRELMELFTMGQTHRDGSSNYTEKDVREMARAFTGMTINYGTYEITLRHDLADSGTKTILGVTGEHGYEEALDILFSERDEQIAWFICGKLAREFIHPKVEDEVIEALAQTFIASNWEIQPVMERLLSSEAFLSRGTMGARVKSPAEFVFGMMTVFRQEVTPIQWFQMATMGQELGSPPNVGGWTSDTGWLKSSTLSERIRQIDGELDNVDPTAPPFGIWRKVALQFHDPATQDAPFQLVENLLPELFAVPIAELPIVTFDEEFRGDLIQHPVPDRIANGPSWKRDLAKQLLGDAPWYEWSIHSESGTRGFMRFIAYLLTLPDYQLY